MSFDILPTDRFLRQLKRLLRKYPSLKDDVAKLGKSLSVDPKQGSALGNDCYKVRLAISSKGKGKSSGARIITFAVIKEGKVYLLSIYDKSEQSSITDQDLQDLLKSL